MKHVALVSNSFMSLYNFRHEFIFSLLEQYKVTLICPMENGDDERFIEYADKGCGLETVEFVRRGKNPFADMKLQNTFLKILKRVKPDIVITYTIKPNIYCGNACIKLGIPYFINVTGLGVAFEKEGLLKKITCMLYKKPYNKASRIFFQNDANRKAFNDARLVSSGEIMVPGSGINLERFSYREFKENYSKTFVYIARLQKAKGTDEFFEAALRMKERYPDSEFVVLGNYEESYEDRVNELTNKNVIKYYGWQDNAIDYMDKSGCIVNPSYHEGMSNVCLEAAALGRVVIASDIPGCKEIVEDNVTGILVKPKDADCLFDAMEKYYKLSFADKKEMGRCGREKIKEEFDRNIVIRIYMDEIKKVLGE